MSLMIDDAVNMFCKAPNVRYADDLGSSAGVLRCLQFKADLILDGAMILGLFIEPQKPRAYRYEWPHSSPPPPEE